MTQAFISYARTDEDTARRLAAELERRGVSVTWLDRLVTPGESWVAQLQRAIAQSDLFFVLVSPESEKNQWLASETALALSQSERGRTRIVPVFLSRAAHPPVLLQSIQGIALFDPSRSQRQLDALIQSIESRATSTKDKPARHLEDELTYIRSARDALQKEMTLQASKRAAWSSTITATVTALAAVAGAMAVLLSIADFQMDALQRWALPFALGVFASIAGFLLTVSLLRRLIFRLASKYVDIISDLHKENK